MNVNDLAQLLSEHGELYDWDGYHGCDCGFTCSSLEHPRHVAEMLEAILSGGVNDGLDSSSWISSDGADEAPDKSKGVPTPCAIAHPTTRSDA